MRPAIGVKECQGITGPRRFLCENFGVHVEGGVYGAARGCAEGAESPTSTKSVDHSMGNTEREIQKRRNE